MTFVRDIFERRENLDRAAFHFPGSQESATSYSELHELSHCIISRILKAGVRSGDLVALDIENAFLHALFLVNCARAGIATVSGIAAESSINGILATFSDRKPAATYRAASAVHTVSQDWLTPLYDASDRPNIFPQVTPEALCRVLLTSGTTGEPKATYLTYAMVQERIDSYAPAFGKDFATTRSIMCSMQLSSSLGFGFLFYILAHGGTYCADSKNFDELVSTISKFDVSALITAPATLAEIVSYCETHGKRARLVKSILTAGSLLSSELENRVRGTLCETLTVFYGTTEAGVVSVRTESGGIGDVGLVTPGKLVEIVDAQGNLLPRGKSGAIRIRNAQGPVPFYDKARWTDRRAIESFSPGDVGTFDNNNHLVMLGRDDNLINSGGVKTSPEVLEQIISSAPGVSDCGVVTQRDVMGIDRIVALIVLRPGWDQKAFLGYCEAKITSHLLPSKFVAVNKIARNQNGKIDRKALAQQTA